MPSLYNCTTLKCLDARNPQCGYLKTSSAYKICWVNPTFFFHSCIIYLLLVKTNGVAFLELLRRARDCSFPSLDGSPPAPLPEKGQTPLALDPLPPILRDKA